MFELQTLEFEETIQPNTEKRIASLRAKIPDPVLAHYDRLCARGKRGVALLHHQTCTGCHMRVPLGVVLEINTARMSGAATIADAIFIFGRNRWKSACPRRKNRR